MFLFEFLRAGRRAGMVRQGGHSALRKLRHAYRATTGPLRDPEANQRAALTKAAAIDYLKSGFTLRAVHG